MKGIIINCVIVFCFIFFTVIAIIPNIFVDNVDVVEPEIIDELFDANLNTINSMHKLEQYFDETIAINGIVDTSDYVYCALDIVRHKFYHKYSRYNIQENFLAYLAGKFVWSNLSAVVIPDDLMKYDHAACSQQSIVMMELLKRKGFNVRKVGIQGVGGHFCLEVFYNNKWHFYDPDKEPKIGKYFKERPSMEELMHNRENLYLIYEGKLTRESVDAIFVDYSYGVPNEYPAKKAFLFHVVTKFFSFYGWLVFLILFILFNVLSSLKSLENIKELQYSVSK